MDYNLFNNNVIDFLGQEVKFDDSIKEFPFKTSLSFLPLINYWEEKKKNGNSFEKKNASDVLKAIEGKEELWKERVDPSKISQYDEEIRFMLSDVFPAGLDDEKIACALVPFQFSSVFSTKFGDELMKLKDGKPFENSGLSEKQMIAFQTVKACIKILCKVYGVEDELGYPFIMTKKDEVTGLETFYRIEVGTKFVEIKEHGKTKKIDKKKIKSLLRNFYDIKNWLKHLPPENFEFSGFVTLELTDVTKEESLSKLTHHLLEKNAILTEESLNVIQNLLRNILGIPELKIGIGAFDMSTGSSGIGNSIWNSFILSKADENIACDEYSNSIYQNVLDYNKPVVIQDLSKRKKNKVIENAILKNGIRSIIIAPLVGDNDNINGVFEIGSPHPDDLSFSSLLAIRDVYPILSVAVKRIMEEMNNKIRATIKQHYTAIHPTVDWKFTEAAVNFLQSKTANPDAELEDIVFKNIYPLYGLSDIRGSSSQRNAGIQKDLIKHLSLIKKVVLKAKSFSPMPILDEVIFRIQNASISIRYGLKSGDEVDILDFIQNELEPFLQSISDLNEEMRETYTEYKAELDPELGVIYDKRKDFEESLTEINDTVGKYLDEQQEIAQKIFPHYFEKYKTDGVDYNIYIGQALTNEKKFDELYLKNFRLWQLKSMVEVTRITHDLKSKLKVPLQTTQLILVYNSPFSIRFRMDEKHFDVDGAYNIRYEIVKKRIDKAYIRDTNERLTQPGKIAIVYSQDKEAEEYRNYISYLQHIQYIENEVEDLELEELQGANGLKALRVTVAYPEDESATKVQAFEETDELEKILENIENSSDS
ncbi:MAG: GAF domain-containing protein [Bacteroidia bacterium]|nr:GAF domain-containing protein [Bacteroidia bacterium]